MAENTERPFQERIIGVPGLKHVELPRLRRYDLTREVNAQQFEEPVYGRVAGDGGLEVSIQN